MKTLANHPGYQLKDDAADSWNRFERDHGVRQVTSAYRSPAQQQEFINRWKAGGKYNRPPYLYEPAPVSGPRASRHLTGIAVDTPDASANRSLYAEYGFRFLFEYDKVHLEYDPAFDRHKPSAPAPASSGRPTIRRGATGPIVLELQDRLNGRYPAYSKLARDSVFGPAVERVVKEFQRRSGLVADGIVGPKSWAAMGL